MSFITFTGDGTTKTFTCNAAADTTVRVNGVPVAVTQGAGTITFATAPAAGASINISWGNPLNVVNKSWSTNWSMAETSDYGTYTMTGNLALTSDNTGAVPFGSSRAVIISNGATFSVDGKTLPSFVTTSGTTNIVKVERVGGGKVWSATQGTLISIPTTTSANVTPNGNTSSNTSNTSTSNTSTSTSNTSTSTSSTSTTTSNTNTSASSTTTGASTVGTTIGTGTSSYKVNESAIAASNATAAQPALGEKYVEPSTGATAVRRSNGAAAGANGGVLYNYYSRYSCENITGEYLLLGEANSTTSKIIRRSDNAVVATIPFGAYHEVRWHYGTDSPYRLYFVNGGMKFQKIENVITAPGKVVTIKDFDSLVNWASGQTNSRRLYSDQEGTSSQDSTKWVWMATFYDGSMFNVRAYVSYDMTTDKAHFMYPADTAQFANAPASEAGKAAFSARPNMVEVVPDGSGIMINSERAYTGWHDSYIGTIFGSPHIWPFDFKSTTMQPFRAAVDASHSGWAYVGGVLGFVHQDNRRDFWTWVPVSGTNKGYGSTTISSPTAGNGLNTAGIIDFYQDGVGGYYSGVHFGRTGKVLDGWCLESRYYTDSVTTEGRSNNVFLRKIVPIGSASKVWNIAPAFNQWPSNNKQDWNESIACGNQAMWTSTGQAMRIHVPGNWFGQFPSVVDTYEVELPANWQTHVA